MRKRDSWWARRDKRASDFLHLNLNGQQIALFNTGTESESGRKLLSTMFGRMMDVQHRFLFINLCLETLSIDSPVLSTSAQTYCKPWSGAAAWINPSSEAKWNRHTKWESNYGMWLSSIMWPQFSCTLTLCLLSRKQSALSPPVCMFISDRAKILCEPFAALVYH